MGRPLCLIIMAESIAFLLASQSPRRRELMALLGYPVQVMAANADEESVQTPDPAQNVVETAVLKAAHIAAQFSSSPHTRTILVAADTTVALAGEMMNKPKDTAEARRMLQAMRGREHTVHTGFVLLDMASGRQVRGVHTALVTMRPYTDTEIEAYIASGDPMDKAGAYAIQHPDFRPVARLQGCFLSVVGLPVCDLLQALPHFDLPPPADLPAIARAHHHYSCPVLPASG